jgi:metal-sulfur cluster biosynthetic enzyme
MGIHEMGLVKGVDIDAAGHIVVHLRLTSPVCHMVGYFTVEITDRLREIPGVRSVDVRPDVGLDWTPDMMSEAAKRRRREALRARGIAVPVPQSPADRGAVGIGGACEPPPRRRAHPAQSWSLAAVETGRRDISSIPARG